MARKSPSFAIYEDEGIAIHDFTESLLDETDLKSPDVSGITIEVDEAEDEDDQEAQSEDDGAAHCDRHLGDSEDSNDADDERRESAVTTASISTLPESAYETDHDLVIPMHKPYTPPIMRPQFRRAESIRRMQMTSPPPFGSRSPRQSVLRHSRARSGTPRSVRSVDAKGSPRVRRQRSGETEIQQEEEQKHYPLVLLHVTLLPVSLRWSVESMQELVPAHTMENLQLVRSKVSETVLQRGVLIPHPREEYELLEERLLEALELRDERITKCGHFFKRDSTGSTSSDSDHDSGVGSTSDSSDSSTCATCKSHVKTLRSPAGSGKSKWTIRVFAANGLMRSAAWSAAWSEMESVDVEILPWISDDIRRKLDERREEEEVEERERQEEEAERIKEIVEEQVQLAYEQRMAAQEQQRQADDTERRAKVRKEELEGREMVLRSTEPASPLPTPIEETPAQSKGNEVPDIYRPSQIPLSILVRNYLYLLAQDRRNVVIFFLVVVSAFFLIRPRPVGLTTDLSPIMEANRTERFSVLPSATPVSELGGISQAVPMGADETSTEWSVLATPSSETDHQVHSLDYEPSIYLEDILDDESTETRPEDANGVDSDRDDTLGSVAVESTIFDAEL